MPVVQLDLRLQGDEELRTVAVTSGVGHAQEPSMRMPTLEILVVELALRSRAKTRL